MDPVVGKIDNPLPTGGVFDGGLTMLISNVLRLGLIGAGLYALVNILIAGAEYIDAGGNADRIANSWRKIYQSILGLIVMIVSFLIAIAIGQIFFGDPMAILNPTIPESGI